MIQNGTSFRAILQGELQRRCTSNSRYSLRSFARSLKVNHSTLSLILSRKRNASRTLKIKVLQQLRMPLPLQNEILQNEARQKSTLSDYFDSLPLAQYELIADWAHYAILSLVDLPGARLGAPWIAAQLNITRDRAAACVRRLKQLGLLKRGSDGKWRQASAPLKADNEITTPALRECHGSLMEMAVKCMEDLPMTERDMSAIVLPMDQELLPEVINELTRFRRKLLLSLEKKGNFNRVYALSIQFFPLSARGRT